MKLKSLCILALLMTMHGCSEVEIPESQVEFSNKIEALRKALDKAESDNNVFDMQNTKAEISDFIKSPKVTANLWYGKVHSVSQFGEAVNIDVRFKTQEYTLLIVDEKLKNTIAGLRRDDDIYFSGKLGKEMSLTISGAITNPEFRFPPTELSLDKLKTKLKQDRSYIESYWDKRESPK
ncbi:hypothetical protein [Vibrio parahaemolyticus]|uniref:hypothetical protein n=1 Tax=Vibrio parahaemolyticus TaxID=670 RepID=UPI00387AB7D6